MKRILALLILIAVGIYQNPSDGKRPVPITGTWLEENLQDVTLEIYFMSPYTLTYAPVTAADLMRSCHLHITVDTEAVKEHKDLICQMLDTPLTSIDNDDEYLNARICCVLCDKNGEAVFEVAMWGVHAIFVNGVPYVEDPIFYDVIMEFLPEGAATELQIYLEKGFSGLDEVEKLYQDAGGSLY